MTERVTEPRILSAEMIEQQLEAHRLWQEEEESKAVREIFDEVLEAIRQSPTSYQTKRPSRCFKALPGKPASAGPTACESR
jgi:hypothetical protein